MASLPELNSQRHIEKLVAQCRPDAGRYEALYRQLHADPEISLQEETTAAVIASNLRQLEGVEVRMNIGGHGIVGELRNGPGKTVLLRADIDALPMEEQTGLEYASKKRMVDITDNVEKPVMHACGHDMHITSQLAAAELLHNCRDSWNGTALFLFQPNEERGAGAQAMVDDGLYDPKKHSIPKPDIILGSHVMPLRAGKLYTRKGVFGSAADSYAVTVYGRGGHGSRPHNTIDPVVLGSSIVMKLQTIVSRETNPLEAVVVTVGSFQAGSAENVISGEATLLINTRTFSSGSRARVRSAIRRIVNAECQAAGCPKPPCITETSSFPLLYNEEAATEKVSQALIAYFRDSFSPDGPISMGSEDFNNLAISSTPSCFWNYGGIDPQLWDAVEKRDKIAEEIPGLIIATVEYCIPELPFHIGNHNPSFAPVIQPTLTVAIDAYALAALTFLL
jgi:amidohydrolase